MRTILLAAFVIALTESFGAFAVAQATDSSSTAATGVSGPCDQAMRAKWKTAVAALDGKRFAEADSAATELAPTCAGDEPVRSMITLFRAELAMQTGRHADAIALLEREPPLEASKYWLPGRFVFLAAAKASGDDRRFTAGRDRLVRVNEERMLAGDYWIKQERFETPAAFVDAFRRKTKAGQPNDTLFIATPKTAEMPMSYQVNEGGTAALIEGLTGKKDTRDEIGDLNGCVMHSSLIPVAANYPSWRGEAVKLFSDAGAFEHNSATGLELCPGWGFIFPALAASLR